MAARPRCEMCDIEFQHPLQGLEPVGLARRLVRAQPVDARKSHCHAGFVARRARQPLEGDFQHQSLVGLVHHMADRTEFFRGVAPHEAIDLQQLFIGEAEIGLADRHELLALLAGGPDPERVVGIIRGSLAMAALGIHQHGIDDVRVALPFPPLALRAAGQIKCVAALEHHAFDRVGIRAGAGTCGIGARRLQRLPAIECDHRRQIDPRIIEPSDKCFEPFAALDKGQLAQVGVSFAEQIVGAQMDPDSRSSASARRPCGSAAAGAR